MAKRKTTRSQRRKEPESRTTRAIRKQVDQAVKDARDLVTKQYRTAGQIETLLADPKTSESVRYALRSILIEFSVNAQISVDHAKVARTFYLTASFESLKSENQVVLCCLRHLDVLIANPNSKTANTLMKFWDDLRPDSKKTPDPFPAKRKAVQPHA